MVTSQRKTRLNGNSTNETILVKMKTHPNTNSFKWKLI